MPNIALLSSAEGALTAKVQAYAWQRDGVVYTRVREGSPLTRLYAAVLEAFNERAPHTYAAYEMRAVDLLKSRGCQLLIVDAAANLWLGQKGRKLRTVQQQLVWLGNVTGVPMALCGGVEVWRGILTHGPLASRFALTIV